LFAKQMCMSGRSRCAIDDLLTLHSAPFGRFDVLLI